VPLVLGIDSSTQKALVEVRDADSGDLVARGHAPHPATTPPRSEQDPSAWWDALRAAIGAAGDPAREVAAVAVAGQQHGMVVVDADDQVIRPAKLWNDTESAPDARWLIDQLGGEAAWAAACGSVPVAAFTITKLSWLHRREPDAWERVARVCLPHDWLTWKLAGAFVTDRGDASGTGYFSASQDQYRLELLAIVDAGVDWAPRLPRVLRPAEGAGTTRSRIHI
jgi:xylulokinase